MAGRYADAGWVGEFEHEGRRAQLKGGLDESDEALTAKMGYIYCLERDLARAELMHRRTAEHLYRERRRAAEADRADAEELLRAWNRPETGYSIQRTPAHYRGDDLVTCRRAMESAASQETVARRTEAASYWWRCAFKYVWRMWSKADPVADGNKAIDCIRKALAEIGERG